jgi:hypothetical protein
MANKNYTLIYSTNYEINGKTYISSTWNMSLKEFLERYFDKDIYIYAPSLDTERIRGIVI